MERVVGVVDIYQTPYKEAYDQAPLEELIFRATSELLRDAGVDVRDLSNVVTGSSDVTDGRAISHMVTAGSVGSYF